MELRQYLFISSMTRGKTFVLTHNSFTPQLPKHYSSTPEKTFYCATSLPSVEQLALLLVGKAFVSAAAHLV